MKTTRIVALILSLALLCALCGCVTAPAVSEPESEPTTTAATTGTTTTATEAPTTTKAPGTTTTDDSRYLYNGLFASEKEARDTYESYKKMSYEEYFSEPRVIFAHFQEYRTVKPYKNDPSKIMYTEENGQKYAEERGKVYFDAKKYKKDAKTADGGYCGDALVDFFRVDDEIWRWHIPSDTVDVVVRNHEKLVSVGGVCSDIVLCYVENDHPTEEFPWDNKAAHYHVISKNLTLPYADVPDNLQKADLFLWFQKNVYNKK